MSGPTVIGLDLSITATGICGIDGECMTVGGRADLGDMRLAIIAEAVASEAAFDDGEWPSRTSLVVIEDLPTHGKGAGVTGMVHGAVRAALMHLDTPYALIPPATLKKYATGKGNADKTAMALALYKRTGLELADDNQVDAWWLRAAGLQHLGAPVVDLPAAQIEALEKVRWPVAASAAGEGEA